MLFADFALAQRLEGCDASGNAECVQAYARRYPEVGALTLPVAGGYAMYAGADSPLTQAIGLGMSGPVTAVELDQVERVRQVRARRDQGAVTRALNELRKVAQTPSGNTMPCIVDAVRAYATEGEIMGVLSDVFGLYTEKAII